MKEILFESFVSAPFEQLIAELQKFEFKEESGKLALYYFIKKFAEEKKVFAERYGELEAKYAELKKDKSEEEIVTLQSEQMEKVMQLLKCASQLSPLNYEKIKEAIISAAQLEILSGVLINIPAEE